MEKVDLLEAKKQVERVIARGRGDTLHVDAVPPVLFVQLPVIRDALNDLIEAFYSVYGHAGDSEDMELEARAEAARQEYYDGV